MDLYLMQHGEATAEEKDPERPLTEEGRASVQRVAEHARDAGVRGLRCVHSGKLRAEQSAQLLASALGGGSTAENRSGLSPNDPVEPVAEWLRGLPADQAVALVGHLPFLDRLASLLVAADADAHVVRFRMGGLVKLEPKPDGDGFSVAWFVPPDLA